MSDHEDILVPERPLIPNPCLISILLVVSTTTGVELLFHYPPHPRIGPTPNTSNWRSGNSGTSSESSAESGSDDEEEEEEHRSRSTIRENRRTYGGGGGGGGGMNSITDTASRSRSIERRSSRHHDDDSDHEYEEDEDEDASPGPLGHDWDTVLGYKTKVLAAILDVPRSLCKRRFELMVHNTVCLGYPVHVRPDGSWRKKGKRRKLSEDGDNDAAEEENGVDEGNEADEEDEGQSPVQTAKPEINGVAEQEDKPVVNGPDCGPTGEEMDNKDKSEKSSKMSKFHVVFVMNPPQLEYHTRVADMYECIVKPFTRALKYEQASDNYVQRESDIISEIRDKAARNGTGIQDLWTHILNESNLAHAISRLYQAVSGSRIAHMVINGNLDVSLHIPVVSQIDSLPSLVDPQLPGMYLTTAPPLGDVESEEDSMLVQHYTLLFLEDPETILKDIGPEDPMNASLIQFIKCAHPTLSFSQIATEAGLSLPDIGVLARHLVYWRKARAIPPLHHRNYYIVSPNADMKKLCTQINIYNRLFPAFPSLPEMLSMLSSKPRPFTTWIPTRDHRMAYLDILAWLMRHGWVIQLRSFAWLKITRDIKIAVAEQYHADEREREEREREEAANTDGVFSDVASTADGEKDTPITSAATTPVKEKKKITDEPLDLNQVLKFDKNVNFEQRSRSPIPLLPDARRGVVVAINGKSAIGGNKKKTKIDFTDMEDSILLDPMRPTPLESAWMEQLTRDCPPDVVALFDRSVSFPKIS